MRQCAARSETVLCNSTQLAQTACSVGNGLLVERPAVKLVRCVDVRLFNAVTIGAKEQSWPAVQDFQVPTG